MESNTNIDIPEDRDVTTGPKGPSEISTTELSVVDNAMLLFDSFDPELKQIADVEAIIDLLEALEVFDDENRGKAAKAFAKMLRHFATNDQITRQDFVNLASEPIFKDLFVSEHNTNDTDPVSADMDDTAQSIRMIFQEVAGGNTFVVEEDIPRLVQALAVTEDVDVLEVSVEMLNEMIERQPDRRLPEDELLEAYALGQLDELVKPLQTIEDILSELDQAGADSLRQQLRRGSNTSTGSLYDNISNLESANIWNRMRSIRQSSRSIHRTNPRSIRRANNKSLKQVRMRQMSDPIPAVTEEEFLIEPDTEIAIDAIKKKYMSVKRRTASRRRRLGHGLASTSADELHEDEQSKRLYLKHIFSHKTQNVNQMDLKSFASMLSDAPMIKSIPQFQSDKFVTTMFERLDTHGNGHLTFDDFYEAFNIMFDENGDSTVYPYPDDFYSVCFTAMVEEIDRLNADAVLKEQAHQEELNSSQQMLDLKNRVIIGAEERDMETQNYYNEVEKLKIQLEQAQKRVADRDALPLLPKSSAPVEAASSDLEREVDRLNIELNLKIESISKLNMDLDVQKKAFASLEAKYSKLHTFNEDSKTQLQQLREEKTNIAKELASTTKELSVSNQSAIDKEDQFREIVRELEIRNKTLEAELDRLKIQLHDADEATAAAKRELEQILSDQIQTSTQAQKSTRIPLMKSFISGLTNVIEQLEASAEQQVILQLTAELAVASESVAQAEEAIRKADDDNKPVFHAKLKTATTQMLNAISKLNHQLKESRDQKFLNHDNPSTATEISNSDDVDAFEELGAMLGDTRDLARQTIQLRSELADAKKEVDQMPALKARIAEAEMLLEKAEAHELLRVESTTAAKEDLEKSQQQVLDLGAKLEESKASADVCAAKLIDATTELAQKNLTVVRLEHTIDTLRAQAEAITSKADQDAQDYAKKSAIADKSIIDLQGLLTTQGTAIAELSKQLADARHGEESAELRASANQAELIKKEGLIVRLQEDADKLMTKLEMCNKSMTELKDSKIALQEAEELIDEMEASMTQMEENQEKMKSEAEEIATQVEDELRSAAEREVNVHQNIAEVRAAKITELESVITEQQLWKKELEMLQVQLQNAQAEASMATLAKAQLESKALMNVPAHESSQTMPQDIADFESCLDEQLAAGKIDTYWVKQYVNLKEQYHASNVATVQHENDQLIASATESKHAMEGQLSELRLQLEQAEKNAEQYAKRLEVSKVSDGQLEEALLQITQLTTELADVQNKVASVQGELVATTEQHNQLTEEHTRLNKNYISCRLDRDELAADKVMLTDEFDRLKSEHKALTGNYDTLLQDRDRLNKELDEQKQIKDKIEKRHKTSVLDNERLKAEQNQSKALLNRSTINLEDERKAVAELSTKLEEQVALKRELKQSQKRSQKYKAAYKTLKDDHAHALSELADADRTIAELNRRNQELVAHAAGWEEHATNLENHASAMENHAHQVTIASRALAADHFDDDGDQHQSKIPANAKWGLSQFSWVGREVHTAFKNSTSWLRQQSFGSAINSIPVYIVQSPSHTSTNAALVVTDSVLRLTTSEGNVTEWKLDTIAQYATKGDVVMFEITDGSILELKLLSRA